MELDRIAQLAALAVFSVNAALMAALILLKVVHRRSMARHEKRRQRYIGTLSRHLSFENCTDPITASMAEDPAFLDALIDMRNAIAGDEIATLRRIVDRHGMVERQVRRLESSFPLGRRLRAAVALAEIGDASAAPALMRFLEDREPEIRIQCARGLGRIQWTPAIDPITWRFHIETPWVRARFSDTLIGFGTKATSPLLAYIRINHRFESRGPVMALRTLAQIQDQQAVGPLLEILEVADDLEVEIATIEALGELGNPEALLALLSRLDSERWELRAKSASALAWIGDPAALSPLRRMLRDESWWVRRSAAAAMAKLPGGIEGLYDALGDTDLYAADAAAEALTDAGEVVATSWTAEDSIETEPVLAHMAVDGIAS